MSGAEGRGTQRSRRDTSGQTAKGEARPEVETRSDEGVALETEVATDIATDVAAEGASSVEGSRIEQLEAELAEAVRARDEYLDSLQRLQAEFDNYRRRARREIGEASDSARISVLKEFLPVLDNLERALNAAEHHEEGKVLDGVRLTRSMFSELLRKEGVEEVDPRGQSFDPNLHEAMLARPGSEPEGTVVDVFEKGYAIGERVLRPARVVVSSGNAPKAE